MADPYSEGDDKPSESGSPTDYNADGSGIVDNTTYKPQKPMDQASDFMLRPSILQSQDDGDDSSLRDAEVKVEAEKVVIEGEIEGLEKDPPAPPAGGSGQGAGQGPPQASPPATGLGAAGPLTVDSVGDYLDDYTGEEWQAIDQQSRQRANEARQRMQDQAKQRKEQKEQADQDRADNRAAGKKARAKAKLDKFKKNNPGEEPPADLLRDAGDFGGDDAANADALGDAGDKAAGMQEEPPPLGVDVPKKGKQDEPPLPDKDAPKEEEEGLEGESRIGPSKPPKTGTLFPQDQDATPEHLRQQLEIDLTHSPSSDALTHARGQDQEALHHAMDKATDSIKTSTGSIVHMMEEMSYVLRQHEYKIRHLMEIVDIEEKRSEY